VKKKREMGKGDSVSPFYYQTREKGQKKKNRGRIFLRLSHTKTLIHEDPTVRSSIRLRIRDPCTRIYIPTVHFEVKH